MKIKAGAHAVTLTPGSAQFLCGYPHVEHYSTGFDTDLYSSSLYLDDGNNPLLIIANDLLFFTKSTVKKIRDRVSARTGIAPAQIMVTCTHTHSGPLMAEVIGSNESDPTPLPNFAFRRSSATFLSSIIPARPGISRHDTLLGKTRWQRRNGSGVCWERVCWRQLRE